MDTFFCKEKNATFSDHFLTEKDYANYDLTDQIEQWSTVENGENLSCRVCCLRQIKEDEQGTSFETLFSTEPDKVNTQSNCLDKRGVVRHDLPLAGFLH